MRPISVIVPTYNRAALIAETLDTILSQTVRPAEVIVVDDGSTDETQEVLKQFDVRSIVVPNGGDLYARNIGLRAANADLVAFCDSDDLWEQNFLEVMSRQWEVQPHLHACYANCRILRNGELERTKKFDNAPHDFFDGITPLSSVSGVFTFDIVDRLVKFQPFFTSCMMADRDSFLRIGGWDEGTSRLVGSDFATALRMASYPPVAMVYEPLVRIRKHIGNHSADTERMNFGDADVLEYVLKTRPELSGLGLLIKRSIAERRAAAIDAAFARRDYGLFNKYYQRLPADLRRGRRRVKSVISQIAARFALR